MKPRAIILASLIAALMTSCSSSPSVPQLPSEARVEACAELRTYFARFRESDLSRAAAKKEFAAMVTNAKRSDNADMKQSATKLERYIALAAAGTQYINGASTPEEATSTVAELAGKETVKMANICGIRIPSASPTPST